MARFGIPAQGRDPLSYADYRLAAIPTVDSPRDPTTADTNYPIQTIWRNSTTFKECILVGFTNGQAQWKCFTDADGTILEIETDDGNLVQPLAGKIFALGQTVANATNVKPLYTNGATANTVLHQIQLGTTVTPTPANSNEAGIFSVNENQFQVDPVSGMVSLIGSTTLSPILSITTDDGNPVTPNASGNVDLNGETVANATNATPLFTKRDPTTNDAKIQVQVGAAVAPTPADKNDAGLLSLDSTYHAVDSNGFATLIAPTTDGQLLIGHTANGKPSINTLTPGAGISIQNLPGQIIISAESTPGGGASVTNLGINYNAGTGVFKVTSADGTALSASNNATATFQSKSSPGYLVTVSIEADQDFIDDNGTSEIIGNTFGKTSGVAWGNDLPFFLYAVLNDDEDAVAFMISLNPSATSSPAAANIGAPDDAVATNQDSFWSLENIDETVYDENPCICIGAFRMQMSAADDWTVQTLSAADGIGQYHAETTFTLPAGQMGAASGTYITSNAGTEPIFNTNGMKYKITRGGQCIYHFNGQNAGTAGVGAQTLQPVLPYEVADTQEDSILVVRTDFATSAKGLWSGTALIGTSYLNTIILHANATPMQNANIGANDSLQFLTIYEAF